MWSFIFFLRGKYLIKWLLGANSLLVFFSTNPVLTWILYTTKYTKHEKLSPSFYLIYVKPLIFS